MPEGGAVRPRVWVRLADGVTIELDWDPGLEVGQLVEPSAVELQWKETAKLQVTTKQLDAIGVPEITYRLKRL